MLMKQNVNNDVTKDSPKPCKKRISREYIFAIGQIFMFRGKKFWGLQQPKISGQRELIFAV